MAIVSLGSDFYILLHIMKLSMLVIHWPLLERSRDNTSENGSDDKGLQYMHFVQLKSKP